MCVLKQAMVNKGLCSGKCNHPKPQKAVMAVTGSNVMMAYSQAADFCKVKSNCTTACPELGSARCKLIAA